MNYIPCAWCGSSAGLVRVAVKRKGTASDVMVCARCYCADDLEHPGDCACDDCSPESTSQRSKDGSKKVGE